MAAREETQFDSSPLYRTAIQQLDGAAKRLGLDAGIHERLRYPRRALVVSVPTVMDDGRTEVFIGYRVHHNTILGPTKGVHIVLPKLTEHHAIAFQAKRDGRIMFVLPWNDCSIVGTTDTDFGGSPDDVRAEAADIEYIMNEVHALFPATSVDYADIITTFAGLRPLLHSGNGSKPSSRSRESTSRGSKSGIAISVERPQFAQAERPTKRLCEAETRVAIHDRAVSGDVGS